MPSFAFFDLDHTLLPFDTQALFCNYVLRRERWRTLRHLTFIPFALARALRLIPTVMAKRAFMNYLAGLRCDALEAYARDFAEHEVLTWIYPEVRDQVEQHRSEGRTLVLNTASPNFYAKEIARVLGFDHCIATQVETPAVMPYLPLVHGPNNKHEAKIAAMKAAIPAVAQADAATLADSWSYSDSSADLPLLEFAGHGVLVHPSPRLAKIGEPRGWRVILPRRPYGSKAGDMLAVVRQMFGLYPPKVR